MIEWTCEVTPGAGTAAEFAFYSCRGVGDTPEEALARVRAEVARRIAYLRALEAEAVGLPVHGNGGTE